MEPLLEADLGGVRPLVARGKVRDIFEIDENTLLLVATDRISAFDVVMRNGIPQKGRLLTLLSLYWNEVLKEALGPRLQTHFLTSSPSLPKCVLDEVEEPLLHQLKSRCLQVRRLKPFPIEAIVRGYITGSAWKEYCKLGTIHGIKVCGPNGAPLQECEKLERPLYTPSTKAEVGGHDENIHPEKAAEIVGSQYARQIEELSLSLYEKAHAIALERGIIIADVKFEWAADGPNVILIDELITPDSSRFWSQSSYAAGRPQQSFDKQLLRDWLSENGLKDRPDVEMPEWIVRQTSEKYIRAFEMLTGKRWEESPLTVI